MAETITLTCAICNQSFPVKGMFPLALVRWHTFEKMRLDHPHVREDSYVCMDDLDHYRHESQKAFLENLLGDLRDLEQEVMDEMRDSRIVADNIDQAFKENQTMGDRFADRLASFGGSWMFILIFLASLVGWMVLNTFYFLNQGFDPYPYILLNLILSCLAAIQAPIIMMSQKRLEARDRLRSQNDYKVNLKAELEIRHLHAKMDHFITGQWFRFLEFEKRHDRLMNDILMHIKKEHA